MMPLVRFNFPTDDESLKKIICSKTEPLYDLGAITCAAARLRLGDKLKSVFTPTSQILNLLRTLVSIAGEHATKFYPDERAYTERMYVADLCADTWLPICLTGLGGTGKTELLAALRKILAGQGEMISAPGLPSVPMQLLWAMRMWTNPSLTELLGSMSGSSPSSDRLKNAGLMKAVAKRAYACGVCLTAVDEFQFVTQSKEAHTKAAQVLMQLSRIGPPMLFAANYSLLHKLEKRPQEERQRLLSYVLALHPDPVDSQDWMSTLKGQIDAAPTVLHIDHQRDAEAIHRYTFGIKRLVADILVRAYGRVRETGTGVVRLADIEWAYKSPGFAPNREDVELLMKQAIQNRCERMDLWCPIASESSSSNVIQATQAIQAHTDRVNQELLKSSLPHAERKIYEEIVNESRPTKKKPAAVFQIKRSQLTKENLLDAMSALSDQAKSDIEK